MHTIPQLFESSVKQFENNTFIHEKYDGKYCEISYKEIRDEVYSFAIGLIANGIKKDDRVALVAEGRSEWLIAELAVLYTGAISVPLSTKINEPSELLFRIKHAECKYIITSARQLDKIRKIVPGLTNLENIILLDKIQNPKNLEIFYSDLKAEGQQKTDSFIKELNKRWTSVEEDDVANISYTSGTTADPKGIMLTHRNYTANVEQANSLFIVPEWYSTLLILSWDHSFAHTVGLYVIMKNGASLAVVEQGKTPMETLRNIPKNINEIKPVFQLSVPALARSFKKNIESGVKAKGKTTEKLFNNALQLSYKYHGNGWDIHNRNIFKKLLLSLYDKIIFAKVRENFGGRMKFFIGGGALLDMELQRFFYAIGMPMFQGYGLTEAAPVISSNTPDKHKLGSSGAVVKNLDLKILDEDDKICPVGEKGEIVVKGENVMKGYWQNPTATRETLKDGWLYTGDLGYLDKDGFLYVLGRFKSLLIANDGEKYSPEGIEEAFVDHSKFIDQCMLYNDQNPYTVGLFVINGAALKAFIKEKGLLPDSTEALDEANVLIGDEVKRYAKGGEFENMFPQRWLPAAVGILSEPLTEENGMINSTLKMVRVKVTEHHQDILDFLYSHEGKLIDNEKNRLAISKILTR
jgi:long-chain acyl-CoA synthetase